MLDRASESRQARARSPHSNVQWSRSRSSSRRSWVGVVEQLRRGLPLGAQRAEVDRVHGVAFHLHHAPVGYPREHAAPAWAEQAYTGHDLLFGGGGDFAVGGMRSPRGQYGLQARHGGGARARGGRQFQELATSEWRGHISFLWAVAEIFRSPLTERQTRT